MAYRQYIGARYVPLYAGDWDSTRNYEPLTIVTDANGNSYTSMKDVPAGTPLNNRNYWILTSSFSGAVQRLENRVTDVEQNLDDFDVRLSADEQNIENLNGRLSADEQITAALGGLVDKTIGGYAGQEIKNKHYLFMGDSYLRGTVWVAPSEYTREYTDGWAYKAIQRLGLDAEHAESIQTGGASFALSTATEHWQDTVATYRSIQAADDIDVIVLLGGANDRNESYNSIMTGITEFFTAARAKYPNATIMMGVVSRSNDTASVIGNSTVLRAYHDGCINNGGVFLSGLENIASCATLMSKDMLHPTAEGYTKIAIEVANVLRGGEVDFFEYHTATLTPVNDNYSMGTVTEVLASTHNAIKTLKIAKASLAFPTGGIQITLDPDNMIPLFRISGNNFNGRDGFGHSGACTFFITHNGGRFGGSGVLVLRNNILYLCAAAPATANTWVTLSGCLNLQILNATIVADALIPN